MPINIYRRDTCENDKVAYLCEGDWDLANQVSTLEHWLNGSGKELSPGNYVADIGFCWRRDAGGGGSALSPEIMRIMSEIGMWLFLSEYPGFSNSDDVESDIENKDENDS